MAVVDPSVMPERQQTDESLRTERENTDSALQEKQDSAEKHADDLVQRARADADAVLTVARDKADAHLEQETGSDASTRAKVADERAMEDRTLGTERTREDEHLRRERDSNNEALSRLLPLEREKTDAYLLTERARSDDSLANRDDFLGIVSHDLRNLLGAIVLNADILSRESPEGQEGKRARNGVTNIQLYAARMNRLIGDLLDVARIDAGKLEVTPERGDVRKLIDDAFETFQAAAATKGIRLESDLGEQPLRGDFDHDRMLQVLVNLISNSLKSSATGTVVRITGHRGESGLQLSISDIGCGIRPEMLEAIFERFWQVGKNDQRGTGLGLYISRCLVEAHGGRIWAESQPGEGTTFHLTLPDHIAGS
jgi:signal transduction histidine kinase